MARASTGTVRGGGGEAADVNPHAYLLCSLYAAIARPGAVTHPEDLLKATSADGAQAVRPARGKASVAGPDVEVVPYSRAWSESTTTPISPHVPSRGSLKSRPPHGTHSY